MRKIIIGAVACMIVSAATVVAGTTTSGASPTCAGLGGIVNHAHHIIGDYVTELGGIGGGLTWPPAGQVGQTIGGEGAANPGAPGKHQHAPFAPGASFCTGSSSPGIHLDL